jgi:hypothetical protein
MNHAIDYRAILEESTSKLRLTFHSVLYNKGMNTFALTRFLLEKFKIIGNTKTLGSFTIDELSEAIAEFDKRQQADEDEPTF